MRVMLVGVSCVGKSTVGKLLVAEMGYTFLDFDFYVEEQMQTSIERIKNTCFNDFAYRDLVSSLFAKLLEDNPSDLILAMPPSGLFRQYNFVRNKHHSDVIPVVLKDSAKNIFNRMVFYDIDTVLIEEEVVTVENAHFYYQEIKEDIDYFYRSYKKNAKISFSVNGKSPQESAKELAELLKQYELSNLNDNVSFV